MVETVVETGCFGSDPRHGELAKHLLADQGCEIALDQSGSSPRPEHEECMEHRAILPPHDLIEGVVGLSVHRIDLLELLLHPIRLKDQIHTQFRCSTQFGKDIQATADGWKTAEVLPFCPRSSHAGQIL